jgi:hypothetical protein
MRQFAVARSIAETFRLGVFEGQPLEVPPSYSTFENYLACGARLLPCSRPFRKKSFQNFLGRGF